MGVLIVLVLGFGQISVSELVVDASLVACPDLPRKSSACVGFGCWYNVVLGVFCESVSV